MTEGLSTKVSRGRSETGAEAASAAEWALAG